MPDPTETRKVLVETFDQPANRLALPPSAERRDTTSREPGCKKGRPHRTAGRVPTVPATLTNIVATGDETWSEPLATGAAFPTDLVIGRLPSTVDENRNQAGAGSPRTNWFT